LRRHFAVYKAISKNYHHFIPPTETRPDAEFLKQTPDPTQKMATNKEDKLSVSIKQKN
jgi:hypothetical protein